MNILQVTLGFHPATAWGGPVKIVHENSRELIRRGHRVTVYCTNLLDKQRYISPGTFEREVDGIRVVYFHTWRLPWWPGTLGPIWLPDLPATLRREMHTFDVAHLNGYRNLMLFPVARAARRAGVPLVVQPHGALPIIVNSFLAKRLYDRLLGAQELGHLSALIAGQASEREQALAHGVPAGRIVMVPNGMDPTARETMPPRGTFRARVGLDATTPLILFLGRINRKKGADMLVEAFARMAHPTAHLAIVGPDDGQLAEVQALIAARGLEARVSLPGLLTGPEVLAAFRDADLFVLPCRADTFPMVVVEACLAGTPMLLTDRCEIADLVAGRVADVVPFDTAHFAAAMARLLTDRDRAERYRAACPAVLRDTFSLQAVGDQLEALYTRVITERRPTSHAAPV